MTTLKMYYDLYALESLLLLTRPKAAGGLVYDKDDKFCEVAHVHEGKQRVYEAVFDLFTKLSKVLALAVRDYLFLACLGEARHAWQMSALALSPLPNGGDRSKVYAKGHLYNPAVHFPMLEKVFTEGWKSSGGFGGAKWGYIAHAGSMYGELSPFAFLDHCADLEHNGGYVYNKGGVTEITGFSLNVSQSNLKNFLSWKLHNNIILEPYSQNGGHKQQGAAASGTTYSMPVSRLIQKYWSIWKLAPTPEWMFSCYGYHDIEWEYKPIEYEGNPMEVVLTGKYELAPTAGGEHEPTKYAQASNNAVVGYEQYEQQVGHTYERE